MYVHSRVHTVVCKDVQEPYKNTACLYKRSLQVNCCFVVRAGPVELRVSLHAAVSGQFAGFGTAHCNASGSEHILGAKYLLPEVCVATSAVSFWRFSQAWLGG